MGIVVIILGSVIISLIYLYQNKPHEAPPESQPPMFHFQEEQNENKSLNTTILSEKEFEEMKINYEQSNYRGTGSLLEHLREEMLTDFYQVRKCGNLDFGESKDVSIYYMIFQKDNSNDKLFVFGSWEESQPPWYFICSLIVFENNKLITDDLAYYVEHDYQSLINPIDL